MLVKSTSWGEHRYEVSRRACINITRHKMATFSTCLTRVPLQLNAFPEEEKTNHAHFDESFEICFAFLNLELLLKNVTWAKWWLVSPFCCFMKVVHCTVGAPQYNKCAALWFWTGGEYDELRPSPGSLQTSWPALLRKALSLGLHWSV